MQNNKNFNIELITGHMMMRLSLLAAMLFSIVSLGYAQQSYDELDYPPLNEFNKPDITTFTTENGIRFFLVEDTELPLIDVSVRIRTGGVQVSNNKTGLAGITGTVIRSGGTENYPPDSLNTLLENNAARMSTSIGFSAAYAGMNVLKEDFDHLLPVFVDLLTHPAFPDEKVALAKKQRKSSISRRNDNASQIASREFDQLIYGKDSVYGRTAEYATINNINRKDLVAFHEQNYVGQNMMVGVVGDFETETMKAKLKEAFSEIPAGQETQLAFPEVDYNYKSTINFINKPDVTQSTVLLGHIGGLRSNPDYAKIQVMNKVLSGGFSGRLFQVVRTDMGLAYSVGGQYDMNSFYPGQFYVQVKTKSATTAEAIDAIIHELERLQNEPITEEELQDTKDQFLNSLVFRNVSYEQILGRRLSNEYRGLPKDAFEQFVEGVKATTVEDVQEMAQQYLHPNQLQILVVGKKEAVLDQLGKYGEVNIIDITIPQPDKDQETETVQGDAQKGRQLLDKMADAIIASGTELNTLSLTGEVLAMGQTLSATMTMDYPNQTMQQSIQTPRGTIKLVYKDGKATMSVAGQKRNLPSSSPMVSGLKASLNRSIVAIALRTSQLNPQYLGTVDFEGTTYHKLNVKVDDKKMTLLIDQKTYLPTLVRLQKFSPQKGKQVTVENHFSEWTTQDGVTYPYKQITYVDGKKATTASYTKHTINKARSE